MLKVLIDINNLERKSQLTQLSAAAGLSKINFFFIRFGTAGTTFFYVYYQTFMLYYNNL